MNNLDKLDNDHLRPDTYIYTYRCDCCNTGIVYYNVYKGPLIAVSNPIITCNDCKGNIFRYAPKTKKEECTKITWQELKRQIRAYEL